MVFSPPFALNVTVRVAWATGAAVNVNVFAALVAAR
jgi:hypothetical protein